MGNGSAPDRRVPVAPARAARRLAPLVLVAALSAACATTAAHRKPAPLDQEGEVYVYLALSPGGPSRLAFAVAGISVLAADGATLPLSVRTREVDASLAAEHLVAVGRVPPGSYLGLVLAVDRASVERGGARTALLVPPEGARVDGPFSVNRGQATLLSLSLDVPRSIDRGFAFAPSVSVAVPASPVPGLVALCAVTGMDAIAILDKHTRRPVAMVPTGRDPMGVALDEANARAYVALAGEDRIEILDYLSGTSPGSIRLRPGDRPREVALGPDDRTLLVVNAGSASLSFLDVGARAEFARVPTGVEPAAILTDADRRRAYVLNRGSSTVTAVDLVSRTVVATVATDAEPVRAVLNRAGNRLHVVHARSPFLTSLSLPDLAAAGRTFVGGGASALEVDPRTDAILVARADDDRVQVFDPGSLMPIRWLELPGPAAALVLDQVENVVFGVIPGRGAVSATDLVSGRVLSVVDVGADPYQLAVAGARR